MGTVVQGDCLLAGGCSGPAGCCEHLGRAALASEPNRPGESLTSQNAAEGEPAGPSSASAPGAPPPPSWRRPRPCDPAQERHYPGQVICCLPGRCRRRSRARSRRHLPGRIPAPDRRPRQHPRGLPPPAPGLALGPGGRGWRCHWPRMAPGYSWPGNGLSPAIASISCSSVIGGDGGRRVRYAADDAADRHRAEHQTRRRPGPGRRGTAPPHLGQVMAPFWSSPRRPKTWGRKHAATEDSARERRGGATPHVLGSAR